MELAQRGVAGGDGAATNDPIEDTVVDPWALPTQGLRTTDPLLLPRKELVEKICSTLSANSSLRISAPPASGKTSLLQLVELALMARNPRRRVVCVPCLRFAACGPNDRTSPAYIREATSLLFSMLNITDFNDPRMRGCVYLLDDALNLYESPIAPEFIKAMGPRGSAVLFCNAFYTSANMFSVSPSVDVVVRQLSFCCGGRSCSDLLMCVVV